MTVTKEDLRKFNDVATIVKRLADQGKFKRQEASYSKLFGGTDEGVEFVARHEGKSYIVERYVSDPEPMDMIQQKLIYFNLEIRSRGKTLELDEEELEGKRESLYKYVARRIIAQNTVKRRGNIMDRMQD